MLLLLSLVGCAPEDLDHDGAGADVDCDDADPFVYPGAPDEPGDGLDADCADGDPPYAWIGDWSSDDVAASTFGIDLFVAGTSSADLAIGDDLAADLTVSGELNPEYFGASVVIDVILVGVVSPVDGPDTLVLYAEGLNYEEQMHVDWACALVDEALECDGGLKALDSNLGTSATFARR